MKNKIETIEDLMAERARLKNQVTISHLKLSNHFKILKEELKPARQVVGYAKNLLVNNGNRKSIVGIGLRFGVDAILKNTILYRASWLARLVVPYIANHVASNYVAKHDTEIIENVVNWVKSKTSEEPKKPENPKVSLAEKALMWVKDVTQEKSRHRMELTEHDIKQLQS
jgi:hypothetical protein